MIDIEIQNCNNISSAQIGIAKNKLNLRYAMNGTGKSTVAKAIYHVSKGENLVVLKTFGEDVEPRCLISQELQKVLLFDEDFVNTIVFRESEVIVKLLYFSGHEVKAFLMYDKKETVSTCQKKGLAADMTKPSSWKRSTWLTHQVGMLQKLRGI